MFIRQMMKLNLGHNAVSSAMSYMDEVNNIFKLDYLVSNKYYMLTTKFLLKKGVLARPPYVTMPKQVEFINDKSYMSGLNLFSDKRSLNTIEVGYINEAVEDNIFAMQMLTGFAQVAKEGVANILSAWNFSSSLWMELLLPFSFNTNRFIGIEGSFPLDCWNTTKTY